MGVCSYFLISFWFEKPANATAAKKAFITNRVGDWGFMVGIFITWFTFGTIQYTQFLPLSQGAATTTATVISIMLFIGAIGKSAQLPLYLWLPDAMAGPTPVSALIHAATMVTAGVYLMVRVNPMLHAASPWVSTMIAWLGVFTALFAATIAISQNDIKKVLAYSTVSQLGYMFLAVGVGGYWVAIFHMITHAFFKALLFLGAGSVIHGMDDEQDMRRMGALRKLMPITAGTFIVGWLAISGVPPFSGFWSKDEILTYALHENLGLYLVGLFTALLTAFYMSREVYLVFYGKARWNEAAEPSTLEAHDDMPASAAEAGTGDAGAVTTTVAVEVDPGGDAGAGPGHGGGDVHPHESPWVMTAPLVVLAFFAAVAGFLNLPFSTSTHYLENWLEPVTGRYGAVVDYSNATIVGLLAVSTVVALTGIAVAYYVYIRPRLPARWFEHPITAKGWYYDWAVTWFMGGPGRIAFDALAWFDRHIIDGAVNGVGALARDAGSLSRRAQTGLVRTYALAIAIGAVLLVMFVLLRTTA